MTGADHLASSRRPSLSLILSGTLLLVTIGYLLWLFAPVNAMESGDSPPTRDTSRPTRPVLVDAVEVRRQALSVPAEATGHLEPWRKVEIRTEMGGRIHRLHVHEGQAVQAGQVLVELDDRDHRLNLKEAEAELLKVQAEFTIKFSQGSGSTSTEVDTGILAAEEAVQRAEDAFEQGLIALAELNAVRRHLETARLLAGQQRGQVQAASTGLIQAEQRVARARLALERTRLIAPFTGRIADLQAEAGQQVGGGELCLLLLDDQRLKVRVDVLEADMIHLRPDTPARIRIPALGETNLVGRIDTINPRIDPETGAGRLTVALSNPDSLLIPGLFAFVELETRRLADPLVVPRSAVLERQERELVFVLENELALWNYVETGARSTDFVEIAEGLEEGQIVAIGGHFALAHESAITIRRVDSPPAK